MTKKFTKIQIIQKLLVICTILFFTAFGCKKGDYEIDSMSSFRESIAIVDSDGDGVNDVHDDFDEDPNRSCVVTAVNFNSATANCDNDDFNNSDDVDADNDGLIEIHYLEDLDYIRYDLNGSSYKPGADAGAITNGAPITATANCDTDIDGDNFYLCGYELVRNLDFNDSTSYRNVYRNVAAKMGGWTNAPGWLPIGRNSSSPFHAIFEGNGNTIANLLVERGDIQYIGLFGYMEKESWVRNLGMINVRVRVRYIGNGGNAGGLVGENRGRIMASYATGTATGYQVGGLVGFNGYGGRITASYADVAATGTQVGGLVGYNGYGGKITASHATGAVHGGDGDGKVVGGLAGLNFENSQIIASYATGNTNVGNGGDNRIGGLVGLNSKSMIIASYAIGSVDAGNGMRDIVGGLVGFHGDASRARPGRRTGRNMDSQIIASYATGAVHGGDGNGDTVGGLVGQSARGKITASYATGNADGGGGDADEVGGLVGLNANSMITASYGFGMVIGGEVGSDSVNLSMDASNSSVVANASALTAMSSSTATPKGTNDWPADVWDFTIGKNPALMWTTNFNASTMVYSCVGALLPIGQICGYTIWGQSR